MMLSSNTAIDWSRSLLLLVGLGISSAACVPAGETLSDIEAVAIVSEEMPTVVTIAWDPPAGVDVWVEYGDDAGYGRVAYPGEDPGRAVLLGLREEQEVHFRLVAEAEGGTWVGDDLTVTTGSLPSGTPEVEVEYDDPEATWGDLVLMSLFNAGDGSSDILAFDRSGRTVWAWESDMFVPGAYLSHHDGRVIYRTDGYYDEEPNGAIHAVDWTGTEYEVLAADDVGHHDIVELPSGAIAAIDIDLRDYEGEPVLGDAIVEYGRDGSVNEVWNAWDTLTPVKDADWGNDANPLGVDWTHANGIDYDPVTDLYLLSLYFEKQVLAISRSTGEIVWRLGGADSDFTLPPGEYFGPQHSPRWVEGGILLYDNRDDKGAPEGAVDTGSRVVRFALDHQAGTATPVWQFATEPGAYNAVMGDAQLLEDGSILLNDGAAGTIRVVSQEGEVLWAARTPAGRLAGRATVVRTHRP